MNKPTPKTELVINNIGGVLRIFVGSLDARTWIETEAVRYGQLLPSIGVQTHYLIVSPLFDFKEVHDYLLSYLDRI